MCEKGLSNSQQKCKEENKPKYHVDLIKAWADGAEIQIFYRGAWTDISWPEWYPERQYRIKPNKKKLWYRNYYYDIEDKVKVYQCISEDCPAISLDKNNIWIGEWKYV